MNPVNELLIGERDIDQEEDQDNRHQDRHRNEEFEQAVSHFGETRKDSLFSGQTGSFSGASSQGNFIGMIRNGFAFNLPIILLGSVAILIYHFK